MPGRAQRLHLEVRDRALRPGDDRWRVAHRFPSNLSSSFGVFGVVASHSALRVTTAMTSAGSPRSGSSASTAASAGGTSFQGQQAGLKNVYDCIKAFSETGQSEDLKNFDVPTLIVHGDDDQIVPSGPPPWRLTSW
jgi:pimeloyl-ACP methyl ester carboxylesterase